MKSITIQELEKELAENLQRQEVARVLLEAISEMQHYKKVNKRFIDLLTQKGLYAWLYQDYDTTHLNVGMKPQQIYGKVDTMDLYKYNQPLTWEIIKNDLARYQLEKCEHNIRARIASHAQDVEALKEIHAFLQSKINKNFYLAQWINEIEYAIKGSQSEVEE